MPVRKDSIYHHTSQQLWTQLGVQGPWILYSDMCFHAMFIANQCLAQIAQIKSHNQGNWGTKNSDKKNTNMDLTWHILTCRLAAKWPRPTPTSSLGVFFSTSINFAASTFPWWTMVSRWKNTTSKVAAQQKTTTVKRNKYQTNKQKTYKQLIKIHTKTPWKNFLFFSESWREHGPWNGWALRKRESEHQKKISAGFEHFKIHQQRR